MGDWRRRIVTVSNADDPRLRACVTLTVRTRSEGLRVVCRFVPGKETSFCGGDWNEIEQPMHRSEARRFASRLSAPDGNISPQTTDAIEAAIFSGVFFARSKAETELLEVIIHEVAGCVGADTTGFAVAASAGVISAVKPHMALSAMGEGSWLVTRIGPG